MDPNPSQPEATKPETEDRRKTFARRALIQAGWALPAVAIFSLPRDLGAASAHTDGGSHGDGGVGFADTVPHSDTNHNDGHSDNGVPHSDLTTHDDLSGGHNDTVHNDFVGGTTPHFDLPPHIDNGIPGTPHGDS